MNIKLTESAKTLINLKLPVKHRTNYVKLIQDCPLTEDETLDILHRLCNILSEDKTTVVHYDHAEDYIRHLQLGCWLLKTNDIKPGSPRRWTSEVLHHIKQLLDNNIPVTNIADRYNVTGSRMYSIISEHKVRQL